MEFSPVKKPLPIQVAVFFAHLIAPRPISNIQAMPIALGALQHALELLDERLPPLRVGPAEQLLGLLPRQLAAVQDRADRLATAPQPKALAYPMDEAAQGPARGWISPFEGGVAAVRWAAQTTSPSSASRRGQKRDGDRRCGGT